jgi:hypothetical protein
LEKRLINKNIHKLLEFNETPIFREFEEKVSDLRAEVKENGKEICALMLKAILNSIFGKL